MMSSKPVSESLLALWTTMRSWRGYENTDCRSCESYSFSALLPFRQRRDFYCQRPHILLVADIQLIHLNRRGSVLIIGRFAQVISSSRVHAAFARSLSDTRGVSDNLRLRFSFLKDTFAEPLHGHCADFIAKYMRRRFNDQPHPSPPVPQRGQLSEWQPLRCSIRFGCPVRSRTWHSAR